MSSKNATEAGLAGGPARKPWSLAARLTIWYAGSAFLLVLLVTGFMYWAMVANLDREDDEGLITKVRVLRAVLHNRPASSPTALQQEVEWVWADRQYVKILVRILDADGRVVIETPNMARDLPADAFPPPADGEGGPGTDVRSANGTLFRVRAVRAAAGQAEAPPYVIQAALNRSLEEEILVEYRRNLWLVLGVAVVICICGGYGLAHWGLRPVQNITATARTIRSTTLHERLVTSGLPAELLALAGTFNDMLDRLEDSFARLARFSADIAHELRTPLNNLRGEAEVALSKDRAPQEYREVLASCLEESVRLSRIIDSFLFLARAENPQTEIAREEVDVGRELAALREFYEAAAQEAGVRLAVDAPAGLLAVLNRSLLQRAVANLVDNALAHMTRGGTLTLSAAREANCLRLLVADTGCGIPEIHLPHVFDRLYRADDARSSRPGSAGLGLALVKSIAELHQGSVGIASQVGQGTQVTLLFPLNGSLLPTEPSSQPAP